MKKRLLLTALMVLLALPVFTLAEGWAAFVDRAHAAMEGQEGPMTVNVSGTVTVLEAQEPAWDEDAPPEAAEKPLIVPDKVQLTIRGGAFESLFLGRGDITLSGVTVMGLADADAIQIAPQGKEGLLRLTIGEDSTVTAIGTGRALATGNRWNTGGSLEVRQLGQLSAEAGACADLQMTGDSGNNALRFENLGGISGEGPGVLLLAHPKKGAANVHMENAGSIFTAGDAVTLTARSSKKGAFATLENQSAAIIASTGETGAAIRMEVTDTASGQGSGQGLLMNKGTIRAAAEPIRLLAAGEGLVPVRIQQSGLVEETSGRIPPVATVYVSEVEVGPLNAEELEALGQAWADAIHLNAMDTGTQMVLVYQDANGAEKERLTVSGMGLSEIGSMTWKEFRTWAETQLALSAGAELRLYVDAQVEAPKGIDSGRDAGLTIPAGKKLILVGGVFEQILLVNGDLELRGVTVNAGGKTIRDAGPRGIYIPAGNDAISVTLTLDEDTTVNAAGEGSRAIYTDEKHKKSCAIIIRNRGRMEGDECVIGLSAAVVGERAVSLTLENTGKILSKGQCVRLTATTQDSPARLTLINDGVIESTGANAVTLTGLSSRNSAFFLVQNGPEGNLRCSTGNALAIRTWDPTAPATNPRPRVPELEEPWGSVLIENQGKIGGLTEPIVVESLLRALFPVEVRGAEHIAAKEAEADLLLTVVYHAEKESRVVEQADYDEVVRAHLKDSYQLPKDLRARFRLRVPATEQIPEDLILYEEAF